jgi:hypothetical protein
MGGLVLTIPTPEADRARMVQVCVKSGVIHTPVWITPTNYRTVTRGFRFGTFLFTIGVYVFNDERTFHFHFWGIGMRNLNIVGKDSQAGPN